MRNTVMTAAAMSIQNRIRTRFILTYPHHPGNVGGAARAMKTMGFDELVLVAPHDPKVLNRQKTKDGASGALHILQNAQIVDLLSQALEGTDLWCATGMPHEMSRSPSTSTQRIRHYSEPRRFFESILVQQRQADDDTTSRTIISNHFSSISFVFGNERMGMTSEDMDLCHVILGIPTNPEFGSLNLASAVQLIAYDWRQALGGFST